MPIRDIINLKFSSFSFSSSLKREKRREKKNELLWILKEIIKFLGSWGIMIARLKLKGIDGRLPQSVDAAAQFDSTRESLPM